MGPLIEGSKVRQTEGQTTDRQKDRQTDRQTIKPICSSHRLIQHEIDALPFAGGYPLIEVSATAANHLTRLPQRKRQYSN